MNDRDLHERVSALFLEARGTPVAERERFLLQAAQGDERLLREVQSLLSHDEADATSAAPPMSSSHPAMTAPDTLPARIGPYRVLHRLGRGGSGYVLLAEQDEPVRRRVAIKIVPHAAISPEFAARFEVERRALERTDHPNIARILDAGRTADGGGGAGGLPYLVMEYVEGAPITEHCRRRSLRLRERIGLMLDVADAVQHAHQRGVIHRDLKPANILVSEQADGLQPVWRPKVLDFGIAKPITPAFGAESPPTIGLPLGTPAYMAPEQSGGAAAHSIDTRADVYALGGVLYELACGRKPIEVEGDMLESLRRIREDVPPPASRVRAQSAAFADDPVPRWLLNDLDCILGRALEKSPERRYPTASAFADDLRRLLRREPIVARPPTLGYRTARFVQRNRVLVASAVIVLAAVLLGFIGLSWGLVEARRQQREASNQTDAQREINRFLTDDLLAAASPEDQGQNITALELLHRASKRVEQRFVGRPLIAGAIHHTLGEAYTALGEFEGADKHLQRAIELRTAAAGPNAPDTLRSQIAAASLLGQRDRLQDSRTALMQVIECARLILGPDDPALYAALNDLGTVLADLDKGPDAVKTLQESLTGRIRLFGSNHQHVLVTMANLAHAYDRCGEPDKALNMTINALRVAESMPDPPRLLILGLNNNVGMLYQDQNKNKEAMPYLTRAAELAKDFLGEDDPNTLTIVLNLAGIEAERGDAQKALSMMDGVIAARTRLFGPIAQETLVARYAYWNAVWHGKRLAEAAQGFEALLPDMVQSPGVGEQHWLTAQIRAALALALLQDGRPQEGLPHAQRAVEQFTAMYGSDHARTSNAADTLQTIQDQLAAAPASNQPGGDVSASSDEH